MGALERRDVVVVAAEHVCRRRQPLEVLGRLGGRQGLIGGAPRALRIGPASVFESIVRGYTSPSFATASRSSWSSLTVLLIRSREKSGTSRPWTICHSPPDVVTGNDEMIPSGTS